MSRRHRGVALVVALSAGYYALLLALVLGTWLAQNPRRPALCTVEVHEAEEWWWRTADESGRMPEDFKEV
jgi:hypothetical protein